MTPAEEIKAAADALHVTAAAAFQPDFYRAVADWLDSFEPRLDDREYDYRDWNAALAIARAYMGTREAIDG